jgi:hypothetical protein
VYAARHVPPLRSLRRVPLVLSKGDLCVVKAMANDNAGHSDPNRVYLATYVDETHAIFFDDADEEPHEVAKIGPATAADKDVAIVKYSQALQQCMRLANEDATEVVNEAIEDVNRELGGKNLGSNGQIDYKDSAGEEAREGQLLCEALVSNLGSLWDESRSVNYMVDKWRLTCEVSRPTAAPAMHPSRTRRRPLRALGRCVRPTRGSVRRERARRGRTRTSRAPSPSTRRSRFGRMCSRRSLSLRCRSWRPSARPRGARPRSCPSKRYPLLPRRLRHSHPRGIVRSSDCDAREGRASCEGLPCVQSVARRVEDCTTRTISRRQRHPSDNDRTSDPSTPPPRPGRPGGPPGSRRSAERKGFRAKGSRTV